MKHEKISLLPAAAGYVQLNCFAVKLQVVAISIPLKVVAMHDSSKICPNDATCYELQLFWSQ